MQPGMLFLVAVVVSTIIISFIWWLSGLMSVGKKYHELKPRLDSLDAQQAEFARRKQDWETAIKRQELEWEDKIRTDKEAMIILSKQRAQGLPFLAEAYADYFHLRDLQEAAYLEDKSHPAIKAAEVVREEAKRRRTAEKAFRICKYRIAYYEKIFPFITDLQEEPIDDLLKALNEEEENGENNGTESDDPARNWLSEAEYNNLSQADKHQLALDRYMQKKKSHWEIGRDYERYIGYLYEKAGYRVYYQGIYAGYADLGRDLIATRGNEIIIIQCKCWSQQKQIHEKHVFQLFGTLVGYRIDHNRQNSNRGDYNGSLPLFSDETDNISAILITSTILSPMAKQVAADLGVKWTENYLLAPYPCIKCNISQRDRKQIYHLPFDQQYDSTIIEPSRGEMYVSTVKEAQKKGFRRAFRWRGQI